ncbi:hypothetical protein AZZ62_002994, partial [Klebsiella variicola]
WLMTPWWITILKSKPPLRRCANAISITPAAPLLRPSVVTSLNVLCSSGCVSPPAPRCLPSCR